MRSDLHAELVSYVERLKALLATLPTTWVVWQSKLLMQAQPSEVAKQFGLLSPFKQCHYLMGLMLTTPEPEDVLDDPDSTWPEIALLLREIESCYPRMYLPTTPDELVRMRATWARDHVTMAAFLHFHNTSVLATPEQLFERSRRTLIPFDDILRSIVKLSASDAIEMTAWIVDTVSENLSRFAVGMCIVKDRYRRAKAEHWDRERLFASLLADDALQQYRRDPGAGPRDPTAIRRDALESRFGTERAHAYWNCFVAQRPVKDEFFYPTDRNPAEERPLIAIGPAEAMCTIGNTLAIALFRTFSRALEDSFGRHQFLARRDAVLEDMVELAVRGFFPTEAAFVPSSYETPTAQYEHDLIVVWKRHVFVVESKASPPVEPFRDPERAYERIRRAFRSDRGIQKAYEQANRIRRALLIDRRDVTLYDKRGHRLATLSPGDFDDVFCICTTADDYGLLATDLSMLLELGSDGVYPWAVNVYDLEAFLNGLRRKAWGPDRLIEYLADRRKLNGKLRTGDELEIAGTFLKHGSLTQLVAAEADVVVLDPAYASVFDEIWRETQGGPAPRLEAPGDVVFTNLRDTLLGDAKDVVTRAGSAEFVRREPLGRNQPCPCGSGRQYKRCHG